MENTIVVLASNAKRANDILNDLRIDYRRPYSNIFEITYLEELNDAMEAFDDHGIELDSDHLND